MKNIPYDRYIFISLVVVFLVLSFLIIKPFIISILAGALIAYIFYPLYKWIVGRIKREFLSSLIVILLVIIIITVPVAFVLSAMYQEAVSTIGYFQDNFPGLDCVEDENRVCQLLDRLDSSLSFVDIKENIRNIGLSVTDKLSAWIYKSIIGISQGVLETFIMFFAAFFLLLDGDKFVKFIRKFLMLRKKHEHDITKTLEDTTYAVVYGNLILALIQGTIAGIGYWLIGDLNNPILWGTITAFFALIPSIGTAIVWGPISGFLILIGLLLKDYTSMTRGIILGIYGFFVVGTVDNILKPKIIGDRAGIHPVIVLLGVFGGLQFMGLIGLILGPLILALLITLLKIYVKERQVR